MVEGPPHHLSNHHQSSKIRRSQSIDKAFDQWHYSRMLGALLLISQFARFADNPAIISYMLFRCQPCVFSRSDSLILDFREM